jgi:hypothetical protein
MFIQEIRGGNSPNERRPVHVSGSLTYGQFQNKWERIITVQIIRVLLSKTHIAVKEFAHDSYSKSSRTGQPLWDTQSPAWPQSLPARLSVALILLQSLFPDPDVFSAANHSDSCISINILTELKTGASFWKDVVGLNFLRKFLLLIHLYSL